MLCFNRGLPIVAAALCVGVQWLAPPVVFAPAPGEAVSATAPREAQKRKRSAKAKLEPFIGSLEEAKKASREQNVPLLIHIILEGEPQNDDYRDDIVPNQELIGLSQKAVVIVTNNGDHGRRKITEKVDGERKSRTVCSVYPWFDECAQHREAWPDVYAEYLEESGEMLCPQTVLLLPDGKLSWRFNVADPPPVSQVIAELKRAQKKAGPGLSRDELLRVRTLKVNATRATDGKLWGDAWRAWHEMLAIVAVGLFADEAKAALPRLEKEMQKELEEVLVKLVPGQAAAAYAELEKLAKECAGSPVEDEVRKAMKRAEKDKAIKEEIAAWKLENEAEKLWTEADELLKKGKKREAEKLLKKLLRKKYAATKVAQRVREEFPDLK